MQVDSFNCAQANLLGFAADDAGLAHHPLAGHAEFDRAQAQPFVDAAEDTDDDRNQHDPQDQAALGRPVQPEARDDNFAGCQ